MNEEQPILEATDVVCEFPLRGGGTFTALNGVSLALRPGSITALVGESGSGKTTLARVMGLSQPVTSGTVSLRGEPVGGLTGSRRRRYFADVQMVLQDPFSSLNPLHKIGYALSRPVRRFGMARSRAGVRAAVLDLLRRVDMTPAEDFIDAFPYQLSGGQRQRVAIARALAARPAVLLGDEPVSMLDVSVRLGVLNLLADLRDRDHLALLYITHDMASARYFADEMYVMYGGRIVEYGPSERVTGDPQHPYTRLLLAASPDPDRAEAVQDLPEVRRDTGGSDAIPAIGCPFQNRCPLVTDQCLTDFPARTDLGDDGWVHCVAKDRDPVGSLAD